MNDENRMKNGNKVKKQSKPKQLKGDIKNI